MFVQRILLLSVFMFSVGASQAISQADTITISGIAPFDQSLGTLEQVQVSVPPRLLNTSVHNGSFANISAHAHVVNTPGFNILGLGVFDYPTVQTTVENPGLFADHFHQVQLPAFQVNYSAAQLSWFLNPANSPQAALLFPSFMTSEVEDHRHLVPAFSAVPTTTYTFTPNAIPEPGCGLAIASLVAVGFVRRR